jgi:hypothetical protein
MQRYPNNLSESDRRIARKWTLASVGFYGSILAGIVLYAALSHDPASIQLASTDAVSKASTAKASRDEILAKFTKLTQRRFCDQTSC